MTNNAGKQEGGRVRRREEKEGTREQENEREREGEACSSKYL